MDENRNLYRALGMFFTVLIIVLYLCGSSKHKRQRLEAREIQRQNLSNYNLELNDRVSIGDDMSILRVVGGLIYSRHGRYGTDSVFVPDVKPIKEIQD